MRTWTPTDISASPSIFTRSKKALTTDSSRRFGLKQISTTLDEYFYTPDDQLIEGEVESGKLYKEEDFNRLIEIKERERKRVEIFMEQINQQGENARVLR